MVATSPRPLPVPAGPDVLDVLPELERALTGRSPVLPYAAADGPPPVPAHDPSELPDGLAVAIGTSGSTGRPKRALLTAEALDRSAWATHQVLGGSGAWLLAMPAHHVAGLQVLLRSLDAGTTPVAMDLTDGFLPQAFVAATAQFEPGQRRYTSLVPSNQCVGDFWDGKPVTHQIDALGLAVDLCHHPGDQLGALAPYHPWNVGRVVRFASASRNGHRA